MVSYRVRVVKARTGESFEGVLTDDGLQSLWAVTLDDGSTKYASVLDTMERLPWRKAERLSVLAPRGRTFNGDDLVLAAEWAEFERTGW